MARNFFVSAVARNDFLRIILNEFLIIAQNRSSRVSVSRLRYYHRQYSKTDISDLRLDVNRFIREAKMTPFLRTHMWTLCDVTFRLQQKMENVLEDPFPCFHALSPLNDDGSHGSTLFPPSIMMDPMAPHSSPPQL